MPKPHDPLEEEEIKHEGGPKVDSGKVAIKGKSSKQNKPLDPSIVNRDLDFDKKIEKIIR